MRSDVGSADSERTLTRHACLILANFSCCTNIQLHCTTQFRGAPSVVRIIVCKIVNASQGSLNSRNPAL